MARAGALGIALLAKKAARQRLEQGLALALSNETRAAEELRQCRVAHERARASAAAVWCAEGSPTQILAARAGATAEVEDRQAAVECAAASLEAARRAIVVSRDEWARASSEEEALRRVVDGKEAKRIAARRTRADEDGE